jgi:hypothetical protein
MVVIRYRTSTTTCLLFHRMPCDTIRREILVLILNCHCLRFKFGYIISSISTCALSCVDSNPTSRAQAQPSIACSTGYATKRLKLAVYICSCSWPATHDCASQRQPSCPHACGMAHGGEGGEGGARIVVQLPPIPPRAYAPAAGAHALSTTRVGFGRRRGCPPPGCQARPGGCTPTARSRGGT